MKKFRSLKAIKDEIGFYYEIKTIDKALESKKDLFSLLQSSVLLSHTERLDFLYDLLIGELKKEGLPEDNLIQISEKHDEFVKSIYDGNQFKLISLFFVSPETGVMERLWYIHCIELNQDNNSLIYVFSKTDGMYEEYKIIDKKNVYGFDQKHMDIYLSEKEALEHTNKQ